MEGRELPVGWTSCSIEDLAHYVTSGSRDWSKYYSSRGAFFVRTENINTNQLAPLNEIARVELPTSVEGKRTLISKDDLLITITGANVGKCAHVDRVIPEAYVSQSVALVRLLDPSLAGFVHKQLLAPSVDGKRTLLQESAYGIGRPVLSLGDVRQVKIYLAPLNEQRRISAKLDTTLAAVEVCRQRLDGVAAILKRFRQAVLAAATSGELTREWREKRGDFSHWQKKRLAELGEFGRGRSRHRPRNDPMLYGGDYPFVQTGDVANAKGDWLTSHSQTYSSFGLAQSRIWPSSTLCITIAANIADTALLEYPACFPDSVVGFVADRAQVEPLFTKWMIDLVADKLESFAPATAQKNINLAILDQIVFSVPPLQEQTEIIARAQHLFTLADQLEARLTTARKVVDRLTPALLAKAFRGELVPQDPADEPASVLLERIRAARQAESAAGTPSRRGRRKAAANPEPIDRTAAPAPSDPLPPDLLSQLLRECGALSERALLAASELEPEGFFTQLERELQLGLIRQSREEGQVLLEAVA